ncbi:peptidase C83 domain-containing protein [Chloropicon primus]|uniref:glutathione gamma-glutamylcysteinyltransferase n=1 Tax=Chloropicon primus TaxID=1764295 RepID=A0A5B8MS58_9CHLO|nr:hypothetical protein A3770_07p50030 [Chloropicon primus]UPR01706.1 peptidase C83 domain-containing protein [Chloropicon primus]|eukprot:QDZ22485.1 hypothetical protein A3770_07p50030 [Chloropicon primus]
MAGDRDQPGAVSFHRRELPRDTCVSFASPRGKKIFTRALLKGTMRNYFALAEQFHTQQEPAYCGLATLVMVLNAMAIDPGRVWKGVWRWFSEELLDCCKDIELVKREGIDLDEFARLARCNGAMCTITTGAEVSLDEFREVVLGNMREKGAEPCDSEPCCSFLCVNYDRGVLGQTGTGHFSPVAGYNEEEDLLLVLDVARFKYPPHWVKLSLLHDAMKGERGFALLSPGTGEQGEPVLGCQGGCALRGFDRQGRPSCSRCGG